jgi:Mce-associated membrane protein
MVIDDVGLHRTAKGAAMDGASVSSEDLLEKAKGKPTKKSKGKSAKKSGKVGAPLNPGSDERPNASHSPESTEPASATVSPTLVGDLSDEPEVRTGGDGVGGSTMTVDVDVDADVEEALHQEPAEPEPVSEPGRTVAETSTIEDDTGSPADTLATTRRRWMHSKVALVSAGAVIVALAVGLALSMSALGNQNALASSRTSALSASRTYAVELASYNYRDLNRDFSTVSANSTPSFRRTFTESSDALKSTLSQYKATAVANVVSAGVVSASTSRAVVLVFLDQNIANSTQTKPTADRSQVEITLVRSGGRWLIDQVTLL